MLDSIDMNSHERSSYSKMASHSSAKKHERFKVRSLMVLCLIIVSFHEGNTIEAPRNSLLGPRYSMDDAPGCPTEHFKGIRVTNSSSRPHFFKANDEVHYGCNCKLDVRPDLQSQHMIFPSDKRTCQRDGTWSGFPPACVSIKNNFQRDSDFIGAKPIKVEWCTADNCTEERENWSKVGFLDPTCSQSSQEFNENGKTNGNYQVYEAVFTFPRHLYLNFFTFSRLLGNIDDATYNVTVQAPSDSLLLDQDLSPLASTFLDNHFMEWKNAKDLLSSKECAITRVDVYARQLFIRFSIEVSSKGLGSANMDWLPLPTFYPIGQEDESGKKVSNGLRGRGCTKPPKIPKTIRRHLNHSVYEFDCPLGSQMVDPLTDEPTSNRVYCNRGHEWLPLWLPVCRRMQWISDSDGSISSQDSHAPTQLQPAQTQEEDSFEDEAYEKASSSHKPSKKARVTSKPTELPASRQLSAGLNQDIKRTKPFKHYTTNTAAPANIEDDRHAEEIPQTTRTASGYLGPFLFIAVFAVVIAIASFAFRFLVLRRKQGCNINGILKNSSKNIEEGLLENGSQDKEREHTLPVSPQEPRNTK